MDIDHKIHRKSDVLYKEMKVLYVKLKKSEYELLYGAVSVLPEIIDIPEK